MSEPTSVLHKHPKSRNFTQVENGTVRDDRLSFRATGLLVYLLSLPDGSRIDSESLAKRKSEGREAVRTAYRELDALDYVHHIRAQDEGGHWRTTIHVFEVPTPKTGFRASVDRASDPRALSLPESKTDEKEEEPEASVACSMCGGRFLDVDKVADHQERGCPDQFTERPDLRAV